MYKMPEVSTVSTYTPLIALTLTGGKDSESASSERFDLYVSEPHAGLKG